MYSVILLKNKNYRWAIPGYWVTSLIDALHLICLIFNLMSLMHTGLYTPPFFLIFVVLPRWSIPYMSFFKSIILPYGCKPTSPLLFSTDVLPYGFIHCISFVCSLFCFLWGTDSHIFLLFSLWCLIDVWHTSPFIIFHCIALLKFSYIFFLYLFLL